MNEMDKYIILKSTIENKISNKLSFSYEEVKKEILEQGGIINFGGYTLGTHIERLEDKKILCYNAKLDKFQVLWFTKEYNTFYE